MIFGILLDIRLRKSESQVSKVLELRNIMCVTMLRGLFLAAVIANSCAWFFDKACPPSECKAENHEEWSYRGPNGPNCWEHTYPKCSGQNQSPIDIIDDDALTDNSLGELGLLNYEQEVPKATIENNGHTVKITPEDDGLDRTISVNGDTYKLAHFHFHWGCDASKGSEHTVDGKSYAMEVHFVHANANGGLAVVGNFYEEGDTDNKELQKIIDELDNIRCKNDKSELKSLSLDKLLSPKPIAFYRYSGSLTTPECDEDVTWSVIRDPIPVGKNQMEQLRNKLFTTTKDKCNDKCKMCDNYRPIQDLNGREVYLIE